MFWYNVWCIIPFLLNWAWDASSVGKHGKYMNYCILSGQLDIVHLFLVAVMYKHVNCIQ